MLADVEIRHYFKSDSFRKKTIIPQFNLNKSLKIKILQTFVWTNPLYVVSERKPYYPRKNKV